MSHSNWRKVLVFLTALVLGSFNLANGAEFRPNQNYEVIASKEWQAALINSGKLTKLSGVITPPLATPRTRSNIYKSNCHLMLDGYQYGSCLFGDPNGSKTIFLFGDSHASQWFPALEDMALKYHFKLYAMTKTACGISTEVPNMKRLNGGLYESCLKAQKFVINKISEVKPDLVILSSRLIDENGSRSKSWFKGMTAQLQKIKAVSDGKLLYLGDTPYPGFDVPKCLIKNKDEVNLCNSKVSEAMKNNSRGLGAKAAKNAGVVYVSTINWFCSAKNCPATLNNTLLYIDSSHITTEASKMYSPLLYDEVKKFI